MPSAWRKTMLYLGLGPDDEYEEYDVEDEEVETARGQRSADARPAPAAGNTPRQAKRPPAPVGAKPPPPARSAPGPARPQKAAPAPSSAKQGRPKPPPPSAAPPPPAKARPAAAKPPPPAKARPAAAKPPPPAKAAPPAPARTGPKGSRPAPKPARPAPKAGRPAPPVAEPVEAARGATDGAASKPRPVVRAVPANSKPYIVTPGDFDAAQEVADKFKAEQPVVMDLRMADGKLARRLLDFSSGVCYSLGGGMEKVGPKVYLLVPEGVEVSSDERRRLVDRGLAN